MKQGPQGPLFIQSTGSQSNSTRPDLRSGETLEQGALHVARVLVAGRAVAHVAAVRLQDPALGVVAEEALQLFLHPRHQLLALDREAGFHPPIEIALHPVRTGEIEFLVAIVLEVNTRLCSRKRPMIERT